MSNVVHIYLYRYAFHPYINISTANTSRSAVWRNVFTHQLMTAK